MLFKPLIMGLIELLYIIFVDFVFKIVLIRIEKTHIGQIFRFKSVALYWINIIFKIYMPREQRNRFFLRLPDWLKIFIADNFTETYDLCLMSINYLMHDFNKFQFQIAFRLQNEIFLRFCKLLFKDLFFSFQWYLRNCRYGKICGW